jgi:DNA-binding NtrC family response regulator
MEQSQGRILVVDDDFLYLRLVVSIIAQMGITAHTATSSEDALSMLERECYAMLITDLNLPGMDGLKLSEEARRVSPELYIVMITGYSSPDLESSAAQAGVAEFHNKPCAASQFRKIVSRVAPRA